jgi:4-hydroxy-3-methylbut-2-en-1-yl diphosphate synthase IspG/GcpE
MYATQEKNEINFMAFIDRRAHLRLNHPMNAKCPKCDKSLSHLEGKPTPIKAGKKEWQGTILACPYCNFAISAQIDVVQQFQSLRADLKAELDGLRQKIRVDIGR